MPSIRRWGRFEAETVTVTLPEGLAAAAKGHAGRPILLGIRPEDVEADPVVVQTHPGARIPARIEVVEPLGAEIFFYLSAGGNQVTARVEPGLRFRPNEQITLALRQAPFV